MLEAAIHNGHFVYSCGNGGSAAIANHLQCDFLKGAQTDTELLPRVVSLSSHLELITAIANDIAYDEVFAYQLRTLARPGDVLLTISSSGNSENIVRAVQWARDNRVGSIALTGFDGGRSATLADPFAQLALPEAALRLKQGFGRLIRRQSDRGAVVLMDHRIANRTYGSAFLDALPRAAVHLGRCEGMAPAISQWLARGRDARASTEVRTAGLPHLTA